jgi:UDP-N-acetylglucosamine transferase subunit ALG13
MLFVTTGTDRGFDRFIEAIDSWAKLNSRNDIFAQIGNSNYEPRNIQFVRFLKPDEFQQNVDKCTTMISHAGMGNVITALSNRKPIIIFPRLPELGETPNGHQIDTATKLKELQLAEVAFSKDELISTLSRLETLVPAKDIGRHADSKLIQSLKKQIYFATAKDRITI